MGDLLTRLRAREKARHGVQVYEAKRSNLVAYVERRWIQWMGVGHTFEAACVIHHFFSPLHVLLSRRHDSRCMHHGIRGVACSCILGGLCPLWC